MATCYHSNCTGTIIIGWHSLAAYLGGYMQANAILRQPDTKSVHVLDIAREGVPSCIWCLTESVLYYPLYSL